MNGREDAAHGRPDGLDEVTLWDRFGGDAEMLEEISRVFLQEYGSQLAAVREAVQRRDAEALARSSHTLKGSVGVFGADAARDCAQQLEACGRANDLTQTERTYADLERQVIQLGRLLARLSRAAA